MFKPEDFDCIEFVNHDDIAAVANQIVRQRGVRVTASTYKEVWATEVESKQWDSMHTKPTHQALLVCIEELPKKCSHEPDGYFAHKASRCLKCKVIMKATWSADE